MLWAKRRAGAEAPSNTEQARLRSYKLKASRMTPAWCTAGRAVREVGRDKGWVDQRLVPRQLGLFECDVQSWEFEGMGMCEVSQVEYVE